MKRIALFFVLLVSGILYGQLSYNWQNPIPQGNNLNQLIINQNRVTFLGDAGTVMNSTDDGNTWLNNYCGSENNFISVSMISPDTGFSITYLSGKIFITTDNWKSYSLFATTSLSLSVIKFFSVTSGYALGNSSQSSKLLKTTDGGLTWSELISGSPQLNDMFFFSGTKVILTGKNGLVKIIEEGSLPKDITIPGNPTLNSIFFVDENTGYVAGNMGQIFNTTDGGNTWQNQQISTTRNLRSIYFVNSNSGWAVGDSGIIVSTSNGGNNWSVQTSGTHLNLKKIGFFDNLIGWAVGQNGLVLRTSNGGDAWSNLSSGNYNPLFCSSFIDSSYGFVAGSKIILKTSDGGGHWLPVLSGSYNFNDIKFATRDVGWAIDNSRIYKTTNGGDSWIKQYETNKIFFGSYFLNSLKGWVCGQDVLLLTTDGGNSWNSVPITASLNSIYFADSLNGWTVGRANTILHSTDGGYTWAYQNNPGFGQQYYTVFFIDTNLGWVMGERILKTTDGGQNWIIQNNNKQSIIYSSCFLNENVGWAAGSDFYITSNGGENWTSVTNSPLSVNSVYLSNAKTGWIIGNTSGWCGGIIKVKDLGLTQLKLEPNPAMEFSLSQNYPNPFNPSTKIEYEINEYSLVTLKVYDLLGNEISILVNEEKHPGKYSANFTNNNLASGTYFYKLTIERKSQTRKMILLR